MSVTPAIRCSIPEMPTGVWSRAQPAVAALMAIASVMKANSVENTRPRTLFGTR